MSYSCSECGQDDSVRLSLTGYYCRECGASWDFIAPENRRAAL